MRILSHNNTEMVLYKAITEIDDRGDVTTSYAVKPFIFHGHIQPRNNGTKPMEYGLTAQDEYVIYTNSTEDFKALDKIVVHGVNHEILTVKAWRNHSEIFVKELSQ